MSDVDAIMSEKNDLWWRQPKFVQSVPRGEEKSEESRIAPAKLSHKEYDRRRKAHREREGRGRGRHRRNNFQGYVMETRHTWYQTHHERKQSS
jgi:hypothetical protein